MFREEVVLQNDTGFHARPVSIFVKEASKFSSEIMLFKGDKKYNAKSIIGLLSMGAAKGDKLIIQAEGEDEEIAVKELVKIIQNLKD